MGGKKVEIVRTTTWSAGPGCHGGCGVLAYIENGKLKKMWDVVDVESDLIIEFSEMTIK